MNTISNGFYSGLFWISQVGFFDYFYLIASATALCTSIIFIEQYKKEKFEKVSDTHKDDQVANIVGIIYYAIIALILMQIAVERFGNINGITTKLQSEYGTLIWNIVVQGFTGGFIRGLMPVVLGILSYVIYTFQAIFMIGGIVIIFQYFCSKDKLSIKKDMVWITKYMLLIFLLLFNFKLDPAIATIQLHEESVKYNEQIALENKAWAATQEQNRIELAQQLEGTITDKFKCLRCEIQTKNTSILFNSSYAVEGTAYYVRVKDTVIRLDQPIWKTFDIGEHVRILYDERGIIKFEKLTVS